MDELFRGEPCTLKPKNTTTLAWSTTLTNLSLHFGVSDRCETCDEYRLVTDFMSVVYEETRNLIRSDTSDDTVIKNEEITWLYWISRVRRQLETSARPLNSKTLLMNRQWFEYKRQLLEAARARADREHQERSVGFLNAWQSVLSDSETRPQLYLVGR